MTQYWFEYLPALVERPNLWIEETMSFNEKLNAITRLVLFLTILGFAATRNTKILIACVITLGVTTFLWYSRRFQKEGFATSPLRPERYATPTEKNPLMNVSPADDPNRHRAAPSFDPQIEHEINQKTKQMITKGDENMEERLFGSLGDEAQFKHSMRAFHPTANTQIPNDQEAFLKFCYEK